MSSLKIYLLGRFDIAVDGKSASSVLSSSKKGRLMLQYLLLHKDESIASSDLYEILWPNEASSNPESALKTLVSRLRAALGKFDEALGKCISTSRGAYCWNPKLPCEIDAYVFEERCKELSFATAMTPETETAFERTLSMYVGDVASVGETESWIVTKSAYWHTLYLRTVYLAIRLLKEKEDYEGVIRMCRRALDVDAFDETVHLELMDALVKTKRSNEALTQYRHVSNLHHNYLGTHPPDRIQNFYTKIIQVDQSMGMNFENIRKSLQEYDPVSGALICDYAVFKDIYHLLMRNLSRMGNEIHLAVVMLSSTGGQAIEPFALDAAMRQLLNAMIVNLRRGDTVTRYSPAQYALLLPSVGAENGRMVMERIRAAFYRQHAETTLTLSYKIMPVDEP